MNNEWRAGQQRQFWLDFARTLAIVSVTINHALSRSFATHEGTLMEFLQMTIAGSLLKALLYVFSRFGVPLFLMISGSLLLKRNYEEPETVQRFLRHNWIELFRTTEIWLVIMFWYLQIFEDSILHTQGIVKAVLKFFSTLMFMNQTTMPSMWYMPMILCIYLMIPVIAIGLKELGDRFFYLLCIIVLLTGMIIPNINTALEAIGFSRELSFAISSTDLFSTYFLFVLSGYWVSKGTLARLKSIWICLCFFISFTGTILFQLWIYSSPIDYYVRYADTGVLFASVFIFEIIRRYADRIRTGKKVIIYLSKISFGIYFVHICIMTGVNEYLTKYTTMWMYTRFLILELTALAGSIFIIWITSKSKTLGRYLYLIK